MATVVDAKDNVIIITSSVQTARAVQKHGLQVVSPKQLTYSKKRYA